MVVIKDGILGAAEIGDAARVVGRGGLAALAHHQGKIEA